MLPESIFLSRKLFTPDSSLRLAFFLVVNPSSGLIYYTSFLRILTIKCIECHTHICMFGLPCRKRQKESHPSSCIISSFIKKNPPKVLHSSHLHLTAEHVLNNHAASHLRRFHRHHGLDGCIGHPPKTLYTCGMYMDVQWRHKSWRRL